MSKHYTQPDKIHFLLSHVIVKLNAILKLLNVFLLYNNTLDLFQFVLHQENKQTNQQTHSHAKLSFKICCSLVFVKNKPKLMPSPFLRLIHS